MINFESIDFEMISNNFEENIERRRRRMKKESAYKYHFVSDEELVDYLMYLLCIRIVNRIKYRQYKLQQSDSFLISSNEIHLLKVWIPLMSSRHQNLKNYIDIYYLKDFQSHLNKILFSCEEVVL